MKKVLVAILLVVALCFTLIGCSGTSDEKYYDGVAKLSSTEKYSQYAIENDVASDTSNNTSDTLANVSERKIIYNVDLTVYADDINTIYSNGISNLEADEWTDSVSISESTINVVFRVKTQRLDAFVSSLSNGGEVTSYNKTSYDVSLDYQDYTNRLASLNTERNKLTEMLSANNITMSDIIEINKRLSEIDLEIGNITGALNRYDSLIDYSEVNVFIYKNPTEEPEAPFAERVKTAFDNGWEALGEFFDWLGIALTTIFPFLLCVLLPIAIIVVVIVVLVKRKKQPNKKHKK